MKYIKHILIFIMVLALLAPMFALSPMADGENWLFIDGINITRDVNMAVIYKDISSTGQNLWGVNIVVDENGIVTEIIVSGDSKGEDLSVPQNGYVISVSGDKADWVNEYIQTGDILYFDSYTRRLFVCDENGNFDPYFSKDFEVEDFQNHGYAIKEPEGTIIKTDYTYGISVGNDGCIVDVGGNLNHYEGENSTALYATTEKSRNDLIMYAPLGAYFSVNDGIASITFDNTRLDDGLRLALDEAMGWRDVAVSEFDYVDLNEFDSLIADADQLLNTTIDYKSYAEMMTRLTQGIEYLRTETEISELRGAFHKPQEKSLTEVRATVLSAKAAGLNSLILRISNGYGTFVPMPEGSKFNQDSKFGNFDVLKSYIDVCKDENVSLTLCFDVYYNEYASVAAPDWLSSANTGEAGLSNKYFSPANIEFRNYYLDYVKYILSNYELESVMFDYLRFPKFTETTDLGYDYNSIERFAKEYGITVSEADSIKTELFESHHWDKWVEYRKGLITDMAKALSDTVRSIDSGISVLVTAERDTVEHYYMQDSVDWITQGLFDGIILNMYERDKDEADSLGDNAYYGEIIYDKGKIFASYTGDKTFLFTALEADSSLTADVLNKAVNDSRLIGSDGFIFSSLSGFTNQHYHKALSDSALRGSTVSPLSNIQEGMKKILNFSKHKIFEHIRTLGGCEEEVGLAALDRLDQALKDLEEGVLSYEAAQKLESDMAVIFAASSGKESALKELKDLTKIAFLYKESNKDLEPDESQPEESNPDENSDISESASDTSKESAVSETSVETSVEENGYNGPDVGTILIYSFVGITALAVVAAMIIGIKRKNTIDPKHHMPKGSAEGYEDKE